MTEFHSTVQRFKAGIFTHYGRQPFALGYGSYRQVQLNQYICRELPECELPEGWGIWLDERAVEYPWFFSRLPSGPGKLLDAGSVLNYEQVLAHPSLREKDLFICTLAPENENHCDQGISYIFGDLRNSCFRDGYFDWIVSISTLEHVGLDNTAYSHTASTKESNPDTHLDAVRELRRILKPGGALFVTLPFGRAKNHEWLQVFDGDMVERLINVFSPVGTNEKYFRYLPSGWQVSSAKDCEDARYYDHSKRRVRRAEVAAAEAVVCLELKK